MVEKYFLRSPRKQVVKSQQNVHWAKGFFGGRKIFSPNLPKTPLQNAILSALGGEILRLSKNIFPNFPKIPVQNVISSALVRGTFSPPAL